MVRSAAHVKKWMNYSAHYCELIVLIGCFNHCIDILIRVFMICDLQQKSVSIISKFYEFFVISLYDELLHKMIQRGVSFIVANRIKL